MKIVYLQYTGHFVEAYRSVFEKGSELYYGQEYCLKIKAGQAQQGHSVTAIQYFEEAYDELLAPNLRAIALGHEGNNNYARLLALVNDIRPDRVIMCFPDAGILRFLRKNKTPVILALADSFESIKWYRIRSQLKLALLKRELRHPHIKWISNHQLNASRSLIKFGIPEGKIIPYDWEHKETPDNWQKKCPDDMAHKTITLAYAGGDTLTKGVYDILMAMTLIKKQQRSVHLTIAGTIRDSALKDQIHALQLENDVDLKGRMAHEAVLTLMNNSDFVVVPSHHEYPEGLPMTIMEGLMTHTPVLVSDHPMFVGRVGKRGAVRFFKEKNARDLAKTIIDASSNNIAYQKMIEAAPQEWQDLILDTKWGDIINQWIDDPDGVDFSGKTIAHYSQ